MKTMQSVCVLCVFASVSAGTVQVQSNPLGKVLDLIDALAAKITKEGEAEAKAYAEFVEWCDDVSKNTQFQIDTAAANKEKLEALISKSAGDADASAAKVEDLAASVAAGEADLNAATAVRTKEAADFSASDSELVDTVDTLGRAIGTLTKEAAKNPAFAQLDTSSADKMVKSLSAVIDAAAFASADRQKIVAMVQSQQGSEADDEELGAPAAATYKSHSSNIIDVLEDLKEKAEEELSGLRKAENSAKHNYSMLKQSLEDQAAADNKDLSAEKAAKAASEETQAVAEGDLATTVKELANANKAIDGARSNCMQTAADHESTVAARNEELKVIAQAKKILADTTGGAVDQSYSMLQVDSRLRTSADLRNTEVVTVVKKLAQEQHSAALAQLASRIAAVIRYGGSDGGDVFSKVKGLISDMISKLESQADADADEKAYCDEQMAKTGAKKSELDDDIESLTTKIDQASSKSAGLKEEVKELQAELAALAQQQAEMDKVRREQNAAYTQAKADLELGLSGVRQALGVLRDYYGGAAAAGSFMQQPSVPQHSQATGAGQSIIGILEVCESDFAKDLSAENMEEDNSQSEYDATSQNNAVTKTIKDQDVKYKTQEFNGLDKSVAELTADKSSESTELSAVMEYFGKIKERCIAKPETYAERAKRRAAEIDGLKEALRILEDETAFVQHGKRGLRGSFLGVSHQ